jgi:2-keto-4-pentenoate hydratase/2-oxohepta-3-ene-1,7-dioic acid hydratase in catechol pathway
VKFIRFADWSTGLVLAGNREAVEIGASLAAFRRRDRAAATRLEALLPDGWDGSWLPMIEGWSKAKADLKSFLAFAEERRAGTAIRKLSGQKLQPPLASRASRTFALGANSVGHNVAAFKALLNKEIDGDQYYREKAEGIPPFGFSVHPDLIVGHGARVAPPKGTQKFDYESEIGVILAKGGRDLPPEKIRIWGFMPWNDWSLRDSLFGIGPNISRLLLLSWNLMKNFDTCTSAGPWVTVDEGHDLAKLRVLLRVNGKVLQDWTSDAMIYSFAETLSFLSKYVTLKPGDMVASGTGPGTAIEFGEHSPYWLKPGDEVEVEIEGVSVLRNKVGAF